MLGVLQTALLLVACSGAGERRDPEESSTSGEQLAGRTFRLTTDPITRSLPESAEVVFLADGRIETEKTGVGPTWELDPDGRLLLADRVYVRDPDHEGCWFSPQAPGFVVGWRLCPSRIRDTANHTNDP